MASVVMYRRVMRWRGAGWRGTENRRTAHAPPNQCADSIFGKTVKARIYIFVVCITFYSRCHASWSSEVPLKADLREDSTPAYAYLALPHSHDHRVISATIASTVSTTPAARAAAPRRCSPCARRAAAPAAAPPPAPTPPRPQRRNGGRRHRRIKRVGRVRQSRVEAILLAIRQGPRRIRQAVF
jgi:hypothetical protein